MYFFVNKFDEPHTRLFIVLDGIVERFKLSMESQILEIIRFRYKKMESFVSVFTL